MFLALTIEGTMNNGCFNIYIMTLDLKYAVGFKNNSNKRLYYGWQEFKSSL